MRFHSRPGVLCPSCFRASGTAGLCPPLGQRNGVNVSGRSTLHCQRSNSPELARSNPSGPEPRHALKRHPTELPGMSPEFPPGPTEEERNKAGGHLHKRRGQQVPKALLGRVTRGDNEPSGSHRRGCQGRGPALGPAEGGPLGGQVPAGVQRRGPPCPPAGRPGPKRLWRAHHRGLLQVTPR